jgi:hypothetical protein
MLQKVWVSIKKHLGMFSAGVLFVSNLDYTQKSIAIAAPRRALDGA